MQGGRIRRCCINTNRDTPGLAKRFTNSTTVKPLLSGHLRDLPKCPLNRGFKNYTINIQRLLCTVIKFHVVKGANKAVLYFYFWSRMTIIRPDIGLIYSFLTAKCIWLLFIEGEGNHTPGPRGPQMSIINEVSLIFAMFSCSIFICNLILNDRRRESAESNHKIQVIILRRINRIPASFQGCWVEQGL